MLERARVRVGVALLVALIAFLIAAARREAGSAAAVGAVLVVLRCIAVVPLSEFSTRSRLFDATVYFLPAGRAFSANAAALALTSATLLFAALLVARRVRHALSPLVGAAIAIVGALLGPYFVRALSRGIAPPGEGAGAALWLIWEIPLCLAATTLLVLAAWGGRVALRSRRRGLDPAGGPGARDARGDRGAARLDGAGTVAVVVRRAVDRRRRRARRARGRVDTGSSPLRPSLRSAQRRWCGEARRADAWSWPSATCAG